MTEATAPLLALVGAGWALLGLAALAGLATLGLIKPPSLDRRPSSPMMIVTKTPRKRRGARKEVTR